MTDHRQAEADVVLRELHKMVAAMDALGVARDVQAATLMGWAAAEAIHSVQADLLAATLRRLADRIESGDPLPPAMGRA
jgi:hypothetical protein